MTIPRENALAFFPASVTVGNITLRPLTLAGAVRLAEIGVDLGRVVPQDKLFQVAWILSETDRHCPPPPTFSTSTYFSRFCRKARVGLNELSAAVSRILNDAFATYVEPRNEGGGEISLTPKGLGMPLEFAEFLCSEYGWSWEQALDTPLVTVYALYAAYWKRNGGKFKGFDYIERTAKPIRLI